METKALFSRVPQDMKQLERLTAGQLVKVTTPIYNKSFMYCGKQGDDYLFITHNGELILGYIVPSEKISFGFIKGVIFSEQPIIVSSREPNYESLRQQMISAGAWRQAHG